MNKYSDVALRALLGLGWIIMIRERFSAVDLLTFYGQWILNIVVHEGHHLNVFVLLDLLL
jgi:hypothetical protein